MNVVEMIQQEMSGGLLNKLSSLTGQGETKTKMAAAAVVPALLSAMSNMASTADGATKLAGMAAKFTPEELNDLPGMTTGQAEQVLGEGKASLTSLFDLNKLTGIVNTLSKFLNIDGETIKKLMGYLTPIIFGTLTKKFGVGGMTGSTLSALFAEQKQHIANAVPPGLSLDGVVGSVGGAIPNTQGSGSFLLPLLLVLALAAAAYWWFFLRDRGDEKKPGDDKPKQQQPVDTKSQPDDPTPPAPLGRSPATGEKAKSRAAGDSAPDPTGIGKDMTDLFMAATDTLNGIKDVPAAEAALPKLTDLNSRLDAVTRARDQLPAPAKDAVRKIVADNLGRLQDLATKVLAIPGVSEKIKPALDAMVDKLKGLAT